MATKPNPEFNKLLSLKKNSARISENIRFLKICLVKNIVPISHTVHFKSTIRDAVRHKRTLERTLIKESIAALYTKLDRNTLETYHCHLKMAQREERKWDLYETIFKIQRGYECEKERKRKKLNKKKIVGANTEDN